MGRKKKSDTAQGNVEDFEIDKEAQLAKFGEDSLSKLDKETIEMFEMKPVGKINKISGNYIMGFNGKNYAESLKLAYEEMDKHNSNEDSVDRMELISYYPQVFMSKSILVGYNLIKNI